jgi:hypothetical protein
MRRRECRAASPASCYLFSSSKAPSNSTTGFNFQIKKPFSKNVVINLNLIGGGVIPGAVVARRMRLPAYYFLDKMVGLQHLLRLRAEHPI